jgi:hypothetical protein
MLHEPQQEISVQSEYIFTSAQLSRSWREQWPSNEPTLTRVSWQRSGESSHRGGPASDLTLAQQYMTLVGLRFTWGILYREGTSA